MFTQENVYNEFTKRRKPKSINSSHLIGRRKTWRTLRIFQFFKRFSHKFRCNFRLIIFYENTTNRWERNSLRMKDNTWKILQIYTTTKGHYWEFFDVLNNTFDDTKCIQLFKLSLQLVQLKTNRTTNQEKRQFCEVILKSICNHRKIALLIES